MSETDALLTQDETAHSGCSAVAVSPLPDWIADLKPDHAGRTSDESWLCQWSARNIRIEFFDSGYVVALAPDNEHIHKTAFCEMETTDREWVQNFVNHGWADTNPSFHQENAATHAPETSTPQ